jgi:hypothetical protein
VPCHSPALCDIWQLFDDRGSKVVELKSDVANHFGLHPNDVYVVGSSKLGFSIADGKRYRPFGDTSDIDIAIVSSGLFDALWQQVFDYWVENGTLGEVERNFQKYLFRGWIRPDLLPPANRFPMRNDWWDFFLDLTRGQRYGLYKIRGGLYKSLHYLEEYQSINVRKCQQEIGGLV